jgi:protease-4
MGAIAASGGYYIAAEADEIWANPGTITGSIGVFAAFPTFEELLERGGIHTDGVGTTRMAGALRLDRPLHPEFKAALDAGIGQAYQQFMQIVADGRDLPLEDVRTIAEGRVWSAGEALENGLVDAIGSLDDAIVAAAARAGLETYSVDHVELPRTPAEMLLQQLGKHLGRLDLLPASTTMAAVSRLVRPFTDAAAEMSALQDPRHIYLRCLACGSAP